MGIDYHGRVFRGIENSENGQVSGETFFTYEQDGTELTGIYGGGAIARGHLLGTVNADDSLDFTYHHINTDGEAMAGRCHSIPRIEPDGRIVLEESWQWLTGDRSSGESAVAEVKPESVHGELPLVTLRQSAVEGIKSQYSAALSTLEEAIGLVRSPGWQKAHPDGPVDQVVFHTLFFTDVYLGPGFEAVKEQAFHSRRPELFQDYEELEHREPTNRYRRDLCMEYLAFCRQKMADSLDGETERSLSADSGFPGRNLSRLALHLYNIRHIQHHAAQLGLRIQLAGGKPLTWHSR